jgi:hypothetical protein
MLSCGYELVVIPAGRQAGMTPHYALIKAGLISTCKPAIV